MTRLLFGLLAVTLLPTSVVEHVLIVADEIPAMEALANQFQARAGLASKIITQAEMPASLDRTVQLWFTFTRSCSKGRRRRFWNTREAEAN